VISESFEQDQLLPTFMLAEEYEKNCIDASAGSSHTSAVFTEKIGITELPGQCNF